MNPLKVLAMWFAFAIAVATVIADFTFHHHVGAKIFTGIAYLVFVVIVFFDLVTTPRKSAPFCQTLTADELATFRWYHVAVVWPFAAAVYAGLFNGFAFCGALWAIAAFIDGGYVTGSLLVLFFFLTAFENTRLDPWEYIARSAQKGNLIATMRQLHLRTIREKLLARGESASRSPNGSSAETP